MSFANPILANAQPKPISVGQKSDLDEKVDLLLRNSSKTFDYKLAVTDSMLKFETKDLEDSVGMSPLSSIFNYIFAVPGKLRRPAFMGDEHFGQRRPNYVDLEWHKFASKHLTLGAYDGEMHLMPDFVKTNEESFDVLMGKFDFDEFKQRPKFILYKNSNEFLQDKIFYPSRGVLGVTKVLGENEIATYFDGSAQEFSHVSRHEFVHWFDMQFMQDVAKRNQVDYREVIGNMNLWMVEGLAEYYSSGWSSTHERIMRDLWHNGMFMTLEELPRFSGSFLTYTFGNFYIKFMEEKFGAGTALKLREQAALSDDLDYIIEGATGHKAAEVDRMAYEYLQDRFQGMRGKVDARKVLTEGYLVGAGDGKFLTLDFEDGHIKMFVNKMNGSEVVSKKLIQDAEYGSESLFPLLMGGGAGMRGNRVVFPVNDAGRDKLVIRKFSEKEDEFTLEGKIKKAFEYIDNISSPRFIDDDKVVFVGSRDGYQDLFSYGVKDDKLERLTRDRKAIAGIDYSEAANALVFSREDGKTGDPNGIDYDFNLYMMDFNDSSVVQITSGIADEVNPRFSPDGKYIVFQKDRNFVNEAYIYDIESGAEVRLNKEMLGIESPQFIANDKVLLNSTKLLVPLVRVQELRSLDEMVKDALEQDTEDALGPLRIHGNELVLKEALPEVNGNLKVNGDEMKGIISHEGKLYFIGEKAAYKKSGDSFSRLGPVPEDKRVEAFKGLMPKDMEFLEKNAMVCGMNVSEDGKSAAIFLNNLFVNRKAFKEQDYDIPEGSNSILLYTAGRSIFSSVKPIIDKFNSCNGSIEHLRDGNIIVSSGGAIVATGKTVEDTLIGKLDKFRKEQEIGGSHDAMVVSKDKRFVAFRFRDEHWYGADDQAIAVYDSVFGTFRTLADTDDYALGHLRFLDDGRLFFSEEADKEVVFKAYDLKLEKEYAKSFSKDKDKILGDVAATSRSIMFSLEPDDTDPALNSSDKDHLFSSDDPVDFVTSQEAYVTSFGNTAFRRLDKSKSYSYLTMLEDIIMFSETDIYGKTEVKSVDADANVIPVSRARYSLNDHVIVSSGDKLYDLDFDKANLNLIAGKSFGFDVKANSVLFSMPKDGVFNIFTYDTSAKEIRQLTDNDFNSFRPVYVRDDIYYEAEGEVNNSVRKIKDGVDEALPLVAPVASMASRFGEVQGNILPKASNTPSSAAKDYSYSEEVIETDNFSNWPAYDKQLNLMGAWIGGKSFFFQGGYIGFNELHNKALSADLLYSGGGFGMGNLGYFDLARDYALRSTFMKFGDNVDLGTSAVKSFPLNSYLSLEGFTGMNYQDYKSYGGVRHNFYPAVGASVSFDNTTFDYLRGPREGTRGFLSVETGYSLTANELNNYDANLDVRNYLPIIGRVGFSERLMAGTSQGPNNHIFLLGGNISMRGVDFDALNGQNYAISNLDFKIPVFEAVGAAFAGTDYLNPIVSAFDVRAGIYYDDALVWYNGDSPKLRQSAGIDVSGIFFGAMILRYNKGYFGEKGWNFWLGYSP